MEVKRKHRKSGKPQHILVLEAAAHGNADLAFFAAHGRLATADDDVSEFYVCPFTQGEYYIDEITNNMHVWLGSEWKEVSGNNQAEHFYTGDRDLHMLLNLAGDLVAGEGNMDTAIMFANYLERVEQRLRISAKDKV